MYVDFADLVHEAILDTLCVEPDEVVPTAMFVHDLRGHWGELMTILGQLGSSLDLDVERFQSPVPRPWPHRRGVQPHPRHPRPAAEQCGAGDVLGDVERALLLRVLQGVERRVVLADTKLEFGHDPDTGVLVLGDEALTPDSSRFWPAQDWEPGRPQPSFDKQYVRDWLTSPASGWDRASGSPPPPLPEAVAAATRSRYIEAYERITGERFDRGCPADVVEAGGA